MPQRGKSLFAAITKVDASTRKVTGIAMQEVVDRTNEKCDYAESKPLFEAWSANQYAASGGKSKGNVREMHTSSAVGIVSELTCDDNLKAFVIEAEVVDDNAWKKVEKGVYTGFSIGANFAKDATGKARIKTVDGVLEWVADPVEVSLVDIPCVPTALFELKGLDGVSHMQKFASVTGIKVKSATPLDRVKDMYDVRNFASALGDLMYVAQSLTYEAQYENDGSQIPARIREWLSGGAAIFLDLSEEESSEFAAAITAQKSATADRQKAGGCACDCGACSGCTKKTKAHNAPESESAMTPEQTKAFTDAADSMKSATTALTNATAEITKSAETIKALAEVPAQVKALDDRMKSIEENNEIVKAFAEAFGEQPAQAKTSHAASAAIERRDDVGTGQAKAAAPTKADKLDDDREKRLAALKAAQVPV